MVSLGLHIARGFFGIAEHVAPRLAGRAAFALFCRTPHPGRLSPKALAAVAEAEPFMDEARRHWLTSAYGSFVCHEFRPFSGGGRATVLVVHGWGSRSEHMRDIISALRARGLRVLALDLPGHGASCGRSLHMASAVAAVKTVEDWFAPLSAVIGHSLGGAVAVNALAGSIRHIAPLATRRLVLIAAPNAMSAIFEFFARRCGLGRRTRESLFAQVARVTGSPLSTFVGANQLARLSIPTLVLHASEDREIPTADAQAHAAAGSHVTLKWIAGAGHRRILSNPSAVAEICAFIDGKPVVARAQQRVLEVLQ